MPRRVDEDGSADAPGPKGGGSELDRSLKSEELPERVECPFCGGTDTEQFSAFGSAVSTSQYYCRRCRSVFEFFKRGERSS